MSKEYAWRTGRTCLFKCFYHLIFVPKYRRDVFTAEMLNRLQIIFGETCAQMGGELIEFNGESDHLHLMVSIPPQKSVSDFVGKLKGKSSYVLRNEFWESIKKKLWGNHFWSPSYCVVSCGGTPLEIVKHYIQAQQRPTEERYAKQSQSIAGEKHHKRRSR